MTKSVADLLSKIDMKKVVEETVKRLNAEKEKRLTFFDSPLCKKMMEEIKEKNHMLESESFAYFPERDRVPLGWGNEISDADVQLFLSVMAERSFGEVTNETEDNECGFFNFSFVREGLLVSLISGQGTSIMVKPFTENI